MRRSEGRLPAAALAGALAAALLAPPSPVAAALTSRERTVLRSYLDALSAGRFAAAFALLSAEERRYFVTPANLASVYRADDLAILGYRILGSETTSHGTVAVVSERVRFLDHAHDVHATVTAKVPFALVAGPSGPVIRDPGHPWRAYAVSDFLAERDGIRAAVRKISFFTGRIELVITFQNRSNAAVTVLPYGRSVLRDGAGGVFRPIATRLAALTDATLYTGLRLPSSGEYTGFLTFATPDRYRPQALSLTLAPALADGADTPFSLELGPYRLPPG